MRRVHRRKRTAGTIVSVTFGVPAVTTVSGGRVYPSAEVKHRGAGQSRRGDSLSDDRSCRRRREFAPRESRGDPRGGSDAHRLRARVCVRAAKTD